jgi:hypothetical protein
MLNACTRCVPVEALQVVPGPILLSRGTAKAVMQTAC